MEFVPAPALLALVKKVTGYVKSLTNRDVNAVVTQLVVWAAAWAALALAAHTVWAQGISVGDTSLADLNGWSQLFVALTIGSGAGVVHDATKAVDRSVDNSKRLDQQAADDSVHWRPERRVSPATGLVSDTA